MTEAMTIPPPSASYSLTSEPWIRVRLADGTFALVSIREAFHRAREIRDISGELSTQDFAILRLLLAIFYRAVGGEVTKRQWSAWHNRDLPLADIDAYLDEFEDRFDLLSQSRPFFQVADLSTAKGEHKDIVPLVFDLPSNSRLFSNRAGSGAVALTLAEAARWLVNAQAFEVSGIKSGALGDERVKGGKGFPIGVGWAGLLGGLFAAGTTLRDTLLLNLVGTTNDFSLDPKNDIPPWEEFEPDTAAERLTLVPKGPVRLFTWQSRRIRLFVDDDVVTGCLIANGDKLTPQNMQGREPMSGWRFSEPQTKAAKQTTYMPREHVAGRALWRGVNALLPGVAHLVPKKDMPAFLPPASVTWLESLKLDEYLEDTDRVLFRAVGVVYGSNNSVVDEVISDELLVSVALLGESNRNLAIQAQAAVELADDGARAVRQLAENLVRAAGGDGEAPGIHARDRAYAALDAPYRTWISRLTHDTVPLDAAEAWKTTARSTLLSLGEQLIADAGPAAWVGREVNRLGAPTLITASRAEGWFRSALTNTFGAPTRKDDIA